MVQKVMIDRKNFHELTSTPQPELGTTLSFISPRQNSGLVSPEQFCSFCLKVDLKSAERFHHRFLPSLTQLGEFSFAVPAQSGFEEELEGEEFFSVLPTEAE